MADVDSSSWNGQQPWSFSYVTTGDVVAAAIVLPILAITAVALRFYVRTDRKVGLGRDDWLLLPALACFIGICITFLIGASNRVMGVPVASPADLTSPNPLHEYVLPQDPLFAKLQFSYQLLLVLANFFVKLSVISLYQRIFVTSRKSFFNLVCQTTQAFVGIWTLAFLILNILACPSSPAAQWSPRTSVQDVRCELAFGAGEAAVITDFLLDLWLIALPQPLIWRLQMPRARRLLVSGIVVLGLSCVGFSAARIVVFADLQRASDVHQPLDRDQVVTVNVWFGALDVGMAIIAACLPPLRPLVRREPWMKMFSSLTGSVLSSRSRNSAAYLNGSDKGDLSTDEKRASLMPSGRSRFWLGVRELGNKDVQENAHDEEAARGIEWSPYARRNSLTNKGTPLLGGNHHDWDGHDGKEVVSSSPGPTPELR